MADSTIPSKPTQKRQTVFWVAILLGCLLAAVLARHFSPEQHRSSSSTAAKTQTISEGMAAKARPGLPSRLKIPKIGANLSIEPVGTTPNADLDVPKNPAGVGWYKDGVRPGEAGSAVIDGHFGWIDGQPAVFNNLHILQKGDEVYVDDETGVSRTFAVTGSRIYAPGEKATAIFYSDDGKERLNIITCEGVWDESQGGYTGRLVVFAVKK